MTSTSIFLVDSLITFQQTYDSSYHQKEGEERKREERLTNSPKFSPVVDSSKPV